MTEIDTQKMKCTWPTREFYVGLWWGNTNFSVRVGGNANLSVLRYQHVGIPNAKLWHWGSKPTRGPNTNGFALLWNIGFTLLLINNVCILRFI